MGELDLRVSKLSVIGNCGIEEISVWRKKENIERERNIYICMSVTNGLGFQERFYK